MTLVKFNPEKRSASLWPGFNDVFEAFFNDTFADNRLATRVPAVNISETDHSYHIELAAPGLRKEDFKLSLDRDVLSVSVEQNANNEATQRNYRKREFSYTSFVRSFTLPEGADHGNINATYADGILCIEIAKLEEAKPVHRQIEIK